MTPLFFFGSDRYANIVLDLLRLQSDLQITHFPNLPTPNYQLPPNIIGLVASFPHLFPPELISAYGGRLYNLHPSLLPQYKNVAPVPYALAMGDPVTGITLQRIDEKIDHGQILAQIEEPITPTDTTPTLLTRLFTLGAQMFLRFLRSDLVGHPTRSDLEGIPLVFTRKLTGDSGYLEWPTVLKLIHNQPITLADTSNALIKLRLTHFPSRTSNILIDLIRALDGYEKVWTVAPTRKGDLRVEIISNDPLFVKIASRPRPISWSDFTQYYLHT